MSVSKVHETTSTQLQQEELIDERQVNITQEADVAEWNLTRSKINETVTSAMEKGGKPTTASKTNLESNNK